MMPNELQPRMTPIDLLTLNDSLTDAPANIVDPITWTSVEAQSRIKVTHGMRPTAIAKFTGIVRAFAVIVMVYSASHVIAPSAPAIDSATHGRLLLGTLLLLLCIQLYRRGISPSNLFLRFRGWLSMAKELRQEILRASTADGTTTANAISEFRNDSSKAIMIRKILYTLLYSTAGPDERGLSEISKSPAIASLTNNNVFYTYPQQIGVETAVALDSSNSKNGGTTYGRGQLTLEPNESLFVNHSKSSGGILTTIYVIEFEFS